MCDDDDSEVLLSMCACVCVCVDVKHVLNDMPTVSSIVQWGKHLEGV